MGVLTFGFCLFFCFLVSWFLTIPGEHLGKIIKIPPQTVVKELFKSSSVVGMN